MSKSQPRASDPGAPCARAASAAAYVQGELRPREREEFDRHLASCAECRGEVATARAVLERLRADPDKTGDTPGVDIVDRVLAALPADAWTSAPRALGAPAFRWASRALQAAAVLVVAATLGLVALRGPGVPGPATRHAAPAAPAESARAEAVTRALAWLVSTQEADGSWDAERWDGQENFTPALTGLAALALLADAPVDDARREAVGRAAGYLAAAVGRSGRIGPRFDAALYNHGIATVALLEAYALTRDGSLKGPIERALSYIRSEQSPAGGWGYAGKRQVNTAITVWQVNALLLASSLGWPEAREPARNGLAWLGGVVDAEGRAGYERRGDFPDGPEGLTAMAALSLAASAREGTPGGDAAARAARSLLEAAARGADELDYYRAFFTAYALRAVEEAPSGTGPGAGAGEAVVRSQVAAGPNSGSFEPRDRWSDAGGRVYATAMAALSLQADENAPRMIAMMRGVPQ